MISITMVALTGYQNGQHPMKTPMDTPSTKPHPAQTVAQALGLALVPYFQPQTTHIYIVLAVIYSTLIALLQLETSYGVGRP